MTRSRTVLLILALAFALVAAVPAVAAEPPVGAQINLVAGTPTTFDADTPFHVLHGWGLVPGDVQAVGIADFTLDVDGVDQGAGSLQNTATAGGLAVVKLKLFNFEDGLPAGTHVLTGHWTLPCRPAVAAFLYPGPCETPNAPVEIFTVPLTVTFS